MNRVQGPRVSRLGSRLGILRSNQVVDLQDNRLVYHRDSLRHIRLLCHLISQQLSHQESHLRIRQVNLVVLRAVLLALIHLASHRNSPVHSLHRVLVHSHQANQVVSLV